MAFIDWLAERNKKYEDAESDDVYEYFNDMRLCGPYEDLLSQYSREVFWILFGNRAILLAFNEMMAGLFSRHDKVGEYNDYFERSGVLKRAHIPEWTKRAVFYRDRGRCVSCGCDLSGLLNAWPDVNFDHIVSLARGGLNDVTNIQLLCAACNSKKGDRKGYTSSLYEDWYPMRGRTSN